MRLTKISESSLGFTLIEMIVVISIIAVLSAISFVSYSSVQRGARDTKRQSDLKIIQSALEQYRADQTYYPAAAVIQVSIAKGSTIYLKKVPIDPTTDRNYNYKPYNARNMSIICDNISTATSCTGYCIYAQLEDTRNINYDPTNPVDPKPKPSFCPDPDESFPDVYNFVVSPI